MNEHPLRSLLPHIERDLGIHPLSYEFIWDAQHLARRSVRTVGPTCLRRLLHIGLTREERDAIFPREFDLGNLREIPTDRCTEQTFWDAVLHDDDAPLEEAHRLLKTTSAITGHEARQHLAVSAEHAFKVAALVYTLKQRPALKQLGAILRPPTPETASLELTNPYWSGAPSAVRYHLADLHSYLSAEIDPERLEAIDGTFGEVRNLMNAAMNKIEFVFKHCGNPSRDEVVRRYRQATAQWQSNRTPPPRKVLRADEQLYVHLHVLDFLHYAEVERRLRSNPLLRRAITPIWHRLPASSMTVATIGRSPMPPSVAMLHGLMCEALGEDLTPRQFRENLADTQHLLCRLEQLSAVQTGEVKVDMVTCLATMIVARELKVQAPSFESRLHGTSHGRSTSVKAALKQTLDSAHEESGRILKYAVSWMKHALAGQIDIHDAKLNFERTLILAAEAVLNTHDIDCVETLLSNLDGYAQYGVLGVVR